MQEKENILRILKETKEAIKNNDSLKLKELSNQTINTASRTQDPDNIATAVIVYSIGKIIERTDYRSYPKWNKFYNTVTSSIGNSIIALEKNDKKGFKAHLELIRKNINNLSGKLKKYISEVFRKASINKASRIYEHGISMEKTAKLLGITMFELAEYTGETGISDVKENLTINEKKRIKLAMDLFKK